MEAYAVYGEQDGIIVAIFCEYDEALAYADNRSGEYRVEKIWCDHGPIAVAGESHHSFTRNYQDGTQQLLDRMKRLEGALREIVEKEGRVCEEFELCKHAACQSSYSAWERANTALNQG